MKKVCIFLIVIFITLINLGGCSEAENPENASSIPNSWQQISSSENSQSTSSADKNTQSESTSTTTAAEVNKETIWKLIDENRVEDITPVFENLRYIMEGLHF